MTYHVSINLRNQWVFRKSGSLRALKAFGPNRTTARQYGRAYVRDHGGTLFIHRSDGMVDRMMEFPKP